jgi:hypothetical protein
MSTLRASEPGPITRSSVRVDEAKTLRPCSCMRELRPHLATLEIRYRRGRFRAVLPACEASLYVETKRLLSTDVVADNDDASGVEIDAPVRFVRVLEEPCGAIEGARACE